MAKFVDLARDKPAAQSLSRPWPLDRTVGGELDKCCSWARGRAARWPQGRLVRADTRSWLQASSFGACSAGHAGKQSSQRAQRPGKMDGLARGRSSLKLECWICLRPLDAAAPPFALQPCERRPSLMSARCKINGLAQVERASGAAGATFAWAGQGEPVAVRGRRMFNCGQPKPRDRQPLPADSTLPLEPLGRRFLSEAAISSLRAGQPLAALKGLMKNYHLFGAGRSAGRSNGPVGVAELRAQTARPSKPLAA